MIFNEVAENEPMTVTLADGEATRTYYCSLAACPNPSCACTRLTIGFYQNQGEEPLHTVQIDVQKRKLASMPAAAKVFAKQFFAQLKEDDFQYLDSMHFSIKCTATEEADLKTIKASFNAKAIESGGLMYAYQEVLPFSLQLTAMIDGKLHLFFDRYCLSSTCGCTEAIFSLFIKEKAKGKMKEQCLVQVDYKRKKWTMQEDFTSVVSLKALRKAAEQQIENFYSELEARHLRLKTIYFHNKPASSGVPFEPGLKVGRNEPCPCGSGKKHKKCCLRKQPR